VKVISPEILMILEADVVCVTEGSIRTTISPNLQSWNIAGSTGTWQGDVSPAGSKTAAWYHIENMGTRETQSVLLTKVRSMQCQAYRRQDTANDILGVGLVHSTVEAGQCLRREGTNRSTLDTRGTSTTPRGGM
jgi:hypothetical protein